MSRFIKNIIIYTVIVSLLTAMVFVGLFKFIVYFENKNLVYSKSALEANVPLSISKIQSCKGCKMILIGGSNVGFGINSELIFTEFGMPVFNAGNFRGLGLRLQIELLKEYMNKGDIIVIIPEYSQFYGSFLGNESMIKIIDSNEKYSKYVSFVQWIHSMPYILHELSSLSTTLNSTGVYASTSLNKYGDISVERIHHSDIEIERMEGELDRKAFKYLRDFMKCCPSTIIFLPPVYHEKSYDLNADKIEIVANQLDEYGIGFGAPPIRYRFSDSLMYDTYYHCTSEGAIMRTNMVIDDMKRILNE